MHTVSVVCVCVCVCVCVLPGETRPFRPCLSPGLAHQLVIVYLTVVFSLSLSLSLVHLCVCVCVCLVSVGSITGAVVKARSAAGFSSKIEVECGTNSSLCIFRLTFTFFTLRPGTVTHTVAMLNFTD